MKAVRYPCARRVPSLAFFLSVLFLIASLGLRPTPAHGQATSTSSVIGQVTDQQGAAVPGTQVTLIDNATNAQQVSSTNPDGRYAFVNVNPGAYTLVFTKTGFSTSRVESQQVEVGTTLTVNSTLQIGSTNTTVEVQAVVGAELQTSSASVGTTISGQAIQALPNLGRDVTTLAVLQPGVTLGGYTAGSVFDQNTYMIDGGNTSDDMAGNTIGYVTNFTGMGGTQTSAVPSGVIPAPIESIEEFKVNTFNQGADFNNSIGSQVQMVTKRGTNQFHGSAYMYYFATNIGAANNWQNNHTPDTLLGLPYTPLPSNHRDRFGGSIGGPFLPRFWGDKWYFFFNYEGFRFPNVSTYERPVPSALLEAGVIQVPNAAGTYVPYNLNPTPVVVNGVTYQPALCGATSCDPRNLGISPIVQQIWTKFMPAGNDPLYRSNGADGYNVLGYLSTIRAPLDSDTYTGRIDHNFGDKWHFMASYRYLSLISLTTNQVDIGGVLPGDTKGTPAAVAPRDQKPGFWVTGMTTNITSNMINDFRYSYLRNFWQWGSANAPAQLPGLGGAVEIASGATNSAAESATAANVLIPYNINTQNVRQRFWDGQDHMVRDDVSWIKGNHLVQFGFLYQRNFDYHSRTDNGNGINDQIVYQVGSSGINFSGYTYPSTLPSTQQSSYQNLLAEVLGITFQPQVAYTRTGQNLNLQSVGVPAFDQDIIPYYEGYFGDTWRLKPTLTLTYSLGYTIEMPPFELNGKQVLLVNENNPNQIIGTSQYLASKEQAALAGQAYDPTLGFATINNFNGGKTKYPYNPYYGEWSPRVSLAWNPKTGPGILGDGKTVIRGGYSRIWGRLNGVNLVLVPLLGVGLIQPVTCTGALSNGTCAGNGAATAGNAFRIGPDGLVAPLPTASSTLSQPFYPGVGANATAGDATVLDPNYKPERTDNFDFTLQRQLSNKVTLEAGYIGRIIKNEYQELNLDAVPYMMTLNGQSFAQAYANVYQSLYNIYTGAATGASANSVAPQAFFESALGGANSAYCKGFSSCTAAVASNLNSDFKNTQVSDIWAALNKAPSWTLGRTMISSNPLQGTSITEATSLGYGNYNALFVTLRARDWHGMTALSNFTWGRSLGTAPLAQYNSANTSTDAFDEAANYGPNSFDFRFTYNLAVSYASPFYKTQHGIVGHILGGWTIAPLFTAQSGAPIGVGYSEGTCTACQAFGEATAPAALSSNAEFAVAASPYTGGSSANFNVTGTSGIATNNPTGVNMFSNPAAVYSEFRRCILGIDTNCGGGGNLRGLPTWNLDATALKDIGLWKEGRVGATLSFQITNVLNHVQYSNPGSLSLTSLTTFGNITTQANTPRNMEFGLRIHF